MRAARARLVVGLAIACGGAFALTNGAFALRARDNDGVALIERSRRMALTQPFTGTAEIMWDDNGVARTTRIAVASDGQQVSAGSVKAGQNQYHDGSLLVAVPGAPSVALPAIAAKYTVTTAPGPMIDDRPTTAVTASVQGIARERWVVDNATGALLQRQVFDATGVEKRRITMVDITMGTTTSTTVPAPTGAVALASTPMTTMKKPYAAPMALGAGYQRVGMYRLDDGTMHVFYSDGLRDISVFQERGRLEWDALPGGGEDLTVKGVRVRRYAIPSGSEWVWERNGVVATAVSDTTADEMPEIVAGLKPAAPSAWEKLRSTVRSWFS